MPDYLGLYLGRGSTVIFEKKQWRIADFDGDRVVIVRSGREPVRVQTGALIEAQPQDHRMELARRMHYTQSFTTYELMAKTTKEEAGEKAAHVLELQTGYKSGNKADALPGEPRPEYDPQVVETIGKRRWAKARELGVSTRSIERWEVRLRRGGVVALTHQRRLTPRRPFPGVDPRWSAALSAAIERSKGETTPPVKLLIEAATANAPDAAPPSKSTAYTMCKEFSEGRGFDLISKTRASINARPETRRHVRTVSYPGEVIQLDTTTLDVFCIDPGGGKPYRPELTVAIDQFTRCILAMVIARTTTAGHVASLMAEIIHPRPMNPAWPGNARWPYHGVPFSVLHTAHDDAEVGPSVTPETIVIDNGKVFTGWDMKGLASLIGFSLEATRPGSGFSKGQVERFFGTSSRGALSRLPGYTGGHVSSTLGDPASQATFTPDALLEYLRQWVATDYHLTKQKELYAPGTEFGNHSPYEMYCIGMETQGVLRAPVDPDLRYRILPIESRKVTHAPLQVRTRKYNSPILQEFQGRKSSFPGGKWPIHWDANDRTAVWLEDDDHHFHLIPWTETVKTSAALADDVLPIVDTLRAESDHRAALKAAGEADLRTHNRYLDANYVAPAEKRKRKKRATVEATNAAHEFMEEAAVEAVTDVHEQLMNGTARPLPAGLGYAAGFATRDH